MLTQRAFDVFDHYWQVGDKVFSSARCAVTGLDDAEYRAWRDRVPEPAPSPAQPAELPGWAKLHGLDDRSYRAWLAAQPAPRAVGRDATPAPSFAELHAELRRRDPKLGARTARALLAGNYAEPGLQLLLDAGFEVTAPAELAGRYEIAGAGRPSAIATHNQEAGGSALAWPDIEGKPHIFAAAAFARFAAALLDCEIGLHHAALARAAGIDAAWPACEISLV